MPRPISWLPRLHLIVRSVASSVRSHYDRHDLETLFELQPRAAQKLLEMLPTVQIGNSRLVDREILASFLERVREAEDTTKLLDVIRAEKAQISRKKVRTLIRHDFKPVELNSLPQTIGLTRGRLEVSFRSVEELAESLLIVARILENDTDHFAAAFEPELPESEPADSGELRRLFAGLKRMEAEHGIKQLERGPSSYTADSVEP